MTQIKIFSAYSTEEIEILVNQWLKKHPLLSVNDIKWSSVSDDPNCIKHTAIVIYNGSSIQE